MKKLMMLLFSIGAAGFVAMAQGAPACPPIGQVLNVELEEAMYWDGDWGWVAYYDGTQALGTSNEWRVAAKNLDVQDIAEQQGDQTDKILEQANQLRSYIDIQENEFAVDDSYKIMPLHVCYYKSSNPNIKAVFVAAKMRPLLGGDISELPDIDPALMTP